MSEHEPIDWQRIGRDLAAPFPPEEVEWRPAGKGGANVHAQLTAYIDGAAVMARLDRVVGPGAWEFRWEPLVMDKNILVAKGILTIHGVTKEDVGTASNWEPSKGCVSDALKRAAVQWGIGRYLRDIPQVSCQLDGKGNIPDAMRRNLAEALRRRMGTPAQTQATQDVPHTPEPEPAPVAQSESVADTDDQPGANEKQLRAIAHLCEQLGVAVPEINSYGHAAALMTRLNNELQRRRKAQQAS